MASEDGAVEDQFVGVVQRCDVCERKTVHIDGVCRDHEVVRVRAPRPAPTGTPTGTRPLPPAPARARRPAPPPPRPRRWRYVISALVIGGAIAAAGQFHVFYGAGTHIHVCEKAGWSLTDTFVDLDAYKPQLPPVLVPPKIALAMQRCQL